MAPAGTRCGSEGHLSATTLQAFSGLRSERRPVGTGSWVGFGTSRVARNLSSLQDLGIELIEVRQVPEMRNWYVESVPSNHDRRR
jgi:hypothetical protein